MRLAGFAMLVALAAGSASAQTVSDPTLSKSKVTQNAQDAVKTGVAEVGTDLNRGTFALQGELQSEAQKDARVDRGLAAKSKDMALGAKSAKLSQDNARIKDGMNESREKADTAMSGANSQLGLGIVSGASGLASAAQGASPQHVDGKAKDPAVKPCKDCVAPTKPH